LIPFLLDKFFGVCENLKTNFYSFFATRNGRKITRKLPEIHQKSTRNLPEIHCPEIHQKSTRNPPPRNPAEIHKKSTAQKSTGNPPPRNPPEIRYKCTSQKSPEINQKSTSRKFTPNLPHRNPPKIHHLEIHHKFTTQKSIENSPTQIAKKSMTKNAPARCRGIISGCLPEKHNQQKKT